MHRTRRNESIFGFGLGLGLVLGLLAVAPARADAGVDGQIIYAQGSSLWQLPAAGGADPVERVTLRGDIGRVLRLASSRDGATLLVVAEHRVLWVDLDEPAPASARPLDCGRPAYLSASGNRIACSDSSGNAVIYDLRPRERSRTLTAGGALLGFLDRSASSIAVSDSRGIWQVPVLTPARRTRVAPHRPGGAARVAPDGARAVGVYQDAGRADEGRKDGSAPAVYSFRLDGKATRRRLIANGNPVAWSADARWVLVQTPKEACMVRAVGGQFKCWRGFRAIGFSPGADHALLSREPADAPPALYRGARDGVQAERPRLLRESAGSAAVWLPRRD